jgi:hypothetical protein
MRTGYGRRLRAQWSLAARRAPAQDAEEIAQSGVVRRPDG